MLFSTKYFFLGGEGGKIPGYVIPGQNTVYTERERERERERGSERQRD